MSCRTRRFGGAAAVLVAVGGAATLATPAGAAGAQPTVEGTAPDTATGTGGVIVKFADGSAADRSPAVRGAVLARAARAHGAVLQEARTLGEGATLVEGPDGAGAEDVAARVAADLDRRADVEYAEPDRRFRPAAPPNDPLYSTAQWDLRSPTAGIRVEPAWARSTGADVVVAVVDTGVVRHPDLAGQLVRGYDVISDPVTARDGGGRDADPTDPGDWQGEGDCLDDPSALSSSWHGTHVAGTIAARTGNRLGIAGIAPGAKVQPVRALGRCGGSLSDIADGITWASGGRIAGAPANTTPARVVNVSLGGVSPCTRALRSAIDGAVRRGTVVVAAAGNTGGDSAAFAPGNCRGVVNVAGSTSRGVLAPYSSRGPGVTLTAPGGDDRLGITSTSDRGRTRPVGATFGALSGTSMASPHVSGVVALMLATRPVAKPAQVKAALVRSARPLAARGGGAGLLDAPGAVAAVTTAARAGR